MARLKRNASQAGLETAASNGDRGAHVTPKKRGRPPKAASAPTEPAKSQKFGARKTSKTSNAVNGSDTPVQATSAAQVPEEGARKVGRKSKTSKPASKSTKSRKTVTQERRGSDFSVEIASDKVVQTAEVQEDENDDEDEDGTSYWLMKAEPESRIEKGRDVKFSIDDLRDAKEPEGWDARNNMRAMRKGDLAFFYHSNTKVPGIAGIMEIVREHSTDDTAFDPDHPYYDPKSIPDKPKWDMVHVEFRQKFDSLLRLKELQKFSKPGGVLERMQTLKQSRLSVSKVTRKEWKFIMSLAEVETEPEAPVQASVEHDNAHENGIEPTGALPATDNTSPATNDAEDNPRNMGPSGSLPDSLQEYEPAGEKEVNLERQTVANPTDIGNDAQAQKTHEKAGKGRKSRR